MTFTEIGAAVGFLTGVYTLFDRHMKGRPIAYVFASGPASGALLSFRVKNVGQEDVVLRQLFSVPRLYEIARDDSALGIAEARFGPFMAVLQPGEQMDFPVFPSRPRREGRDSCAFVILWRRATSPWLPQIPICLFTSKQTIEQLKRAHRGT